MLGPLPRRTRPRRSTSGSFQELVDWINLSRAQPADADAVRAIQYVELADHSVDGTHLLAYLPRLRRLSIGGACTNESFAGLAEVAGVTWLDVSSDEVTPAAFRSLSQWRKLEKLRLWNLRLRGAGLEGLRSCTALRAITLNGCTLDAEAVASIAKLKARRLHLAFGTSKAPAASIAHLGKLEGLQGLDMGVAAKLGDDEVRGLSRAKSLESLEFQANRDLTDASLQWLAKLPKLRSLRISLAAGISDDGLRALGASASLRKVDLTGCDRVTGAGLGHLPKALTELTLSSRKLKSEYLPDLRRFRRITRLSLRGCPLAHVDLTPLNGLPKLTHLELSESGVTAEQLATLRPKLLDEAVVHWDEEVVDRAKQLRRKRAKSQATADFYALVIDGTQGHVHASSVFVTGDEDVLRAELANSFEFDVVSAALLEPGMDTVVHVFRNGKRRRSLDIAKAVTVHPVLLPATKTRPEKLGRGSRLLTLHASRDKRLAIGAEIDAGTRAWVQRFDGTKLKLTKPLSHPLQPGQKVLVQRSELFIGYDEEPGVLLLEPGWTEND